MLFIEVMRKNARYQHPNKLLPLLCCVNNLGIFALFDVGYFEVSYNLHELEKRFILATIFRNIDGIV